MSVDLSSLQLNMPKKKTGQRKKAEKQKERQRDIRNAKNERPLVERPCNFMMVIIFSSKIFGS